FLELAEQENLQACQVAEVQDLPRLQMSWNGKTIVDISREFLNSNGAEKHINVIADRAHYEDKTTEGGFKENVLKLVGDLNICSKRGLSEAFDSTIGAGTVLMPFGGARQRTPIQAMVQKISVEKKHTDDCSLMAWGYNPFISEQSPYHGAYLAVVESVSKLIATGAQFKDVYLTFQEYFERLNKDSKRWGKPLSALLGAFEAQKNLGIGAIGGKDSMSGSFEDIHVPPTLVSFAVTTDKVQNIVSPEFKKAGNKVVMFAPEYDENGLPKTSSLIDTFNKVTEIIRSGKAVACYTPTLGGIADAVVKSCMGNGFGFEFNVDLSVNDIFKYNYGAFLLEVADDFAGGVEIGKITAEKTVSLNGEKVSLEEIEDVYENKLESVYSCNIKQSYGEIKTFSFDMAEHVAPAVKVARPKVLIPAFPGTNCEFDSAKAMRDAGAEPEIIVINNLSASGISHSMEKFAEALKQSQIVFIPGGFSGGDEPDGSGKFITAFFRNAIIKEGVTDLLENRDGLILGICNGFQALIKLGLV
ncbi:MAG: phosphoribosylformylglycinamidine synthase subunit PurQ, partial [Clostridia bacterium]|nr:phosphoribosylformylglycinamidine synthase subunit PurQ [Clostridia bacterium]